MLIGLLKWELEIGLEGIESRKVVKSKTPIDTIKRFQIFIPVCKLVLVTETNNTKRKKVKLQKKYNLTTRGYA